MNPLLLTRTDGRWALEHAGTPEAAKLIVVFGTSLIPLPVGVEMSETDALAFARTTAFGRRYGVEVTR